MEMCSNLLNSYFYETQLILIKILNYMFPHYFLLYKNLFLIHLEDNILLMLVLLIFKEFWVASYWNWNLYWLFLVFAIFKFVVHRYWIWYTSLFLIHPLNMLWILCVQFDLLIANFFLSFLFNSYFIYNNIFILFYFILLYF